MSESLGRRIARLRGELGWTQQDLADRLAISRVAVSHLEMGISVPSERTVTLLAGLLKIEPHELVEGTSYPEAKSERLPLVAARYTEAEFQTRLFEADLAWIDRFATRAGRSGLAEARLLQWRDRLAALERATADRRDRALVQEALARLRERLRTR